MVCWCGGRAVTLHHVGVVVVWRRSGGSVRSHYERIPVIAENSNAWESSASVVVRSSKSKSANTNTSVHGIKKESVYDVRRAGAN